MVNRYYSFKIVTYHNVDIVSSVCENFFKYAYILHDKDINEDNNPISPHFHILCTFKQNKSIQSVLNLFPKEQNTFVLPSTDKYGDFDYLSHSNAKEKFQYDKSDIVTNDLKFFTPKQDIIDNSEFVNDILNRTKTYYEMAIKYGRDYIRNFSRYKEFKRVCLEQLYDIEKGYNEKLSLLTYDFFLFYVNNALIEYCKDVYNINDDICDKLLAKYAKEAKNLLGL